MKLTIKGRLTFPDNETYWLKQGISKVAKLYDIPLRAESSVDITTVKGPKGSEQRRPDRLTILLEDVPLDEYGDPPREVYSRYIDIDAAVNAIATLLSLSGTQYATLISSGPFPTFWTIVVGDAIKELE